MEPSQLLRVLNTAGKTIYRVQLPKEGKVLFLGWEPSGNALAAVQNHGTRSRRRPPTACPPPLAGLSSAPSALAAPAPLLSLLTAGRASRRDAPSGGAFLWFPSKPDSVQQWEGMQFSSQVMKSSVLKRNSHFNTCFACWSAASKLVLGLADGNFACCTPRAVQSTPRRAAPLPPVLETRARQPSDRRADPPPPPPARAGDLKSNETFISRKHFAVRRGC